ncbi:hypothetical protein BS50DRAFT_288502 [Corynespora cassiicola Philippines]|uniref:Uncharacterized protein n=1 Tax=Corynespora cassiicola Philippines TaxID=1448308 RepID=A0A2T2N0T3_CORCC|nr:hypothetical protein BS50DRAFT_288502 [Corynespora cassiicola Philippines]
MDAPSSPSECNDDDSSGVEFTLERRNKISQILHKHHLNYCPEQSLADSLPTPPSSNLEASRSGSDPISVSPDRKTPPSTPIPTTLKTTIARGKKRRRYDVAEGEEVMASQPCAKKNRTTAPAIPARRSARLRNARLQRDTG